MTNFQLASILTGLVFIGIAGCGGERRVPLEGTIQLDGQPLAGAKATFQRKEGPVNERLFVGETDTDGHYSAKPSWEDRQGVAPGTYQVFISSVTIPSDATEETPLPPEPVPARYRDGSQTITVPDDGKTDANFDMKK